ncbi:hypothetical protein HZC30_01580 [Candidatus Woesearchaeota archaeon]|nr:hypothetical protein [Candidatus Woesearchaeota archaeon]
MDRKSPSELGDLLDQIDAAPLLYVSNDNIPYEGSFGACVSCGGKCYNGCKATTVSEIEYNLPNRQPSLDRQQQGDREKMNERTNLDEKTERTPPYSTKK